MKTTDLFFYLLKCEINDIPVEFENGFEFDKAALFDIAKKHDLSHLIADVLIKNNIITEKDGIFKTVRKEKLQAVFRETQISFDSQKIFDVFEKEKIDYLPMKGLIISELYPESWMRTSCDMDILVREEDLDRASEALIKDGFTTDGKKNFHDKHFYSEKTHLELHFNILENDPKTDRTLAKVRENCVKFSGCRYRETNEFFAFHHIVHTLAEKLVLL